MCYLMSLGICTNELGREPMIVQIIGLPGSGKTTLAKELCRRTNGIHINADEVRSELSSDLGFSSEDRIEQARRLGSISRLLSKQGKLVIVDFVNPTRETRKAFGDANFVVWVNRILSSRFEDTNNMWQDPESDLVISNGQSITEEAELVLKSAGIFDIFEKPWLDAGGEIPVPQLPRPNFDRRRSTATRRAADVHPQ